MFVFYLLVLYFFIILLITTYNFLTIRRIEDIIVPETEIDQRILVSVIIPMRNEEHNVETVLDNVFSNEGINYEVIVVNDNSTDLTLEKLNEYKKKRSKANLIITKGLEKKDSWVGKNFALWQGIELSKGELIILMDADVKISSDTIKKTIHILKANDAISIIPYQQGGLLQSVVSNGYLGWWPLTNLPIKYLQAKRNKKGAVACGQFIAARSVSYNKLRSIEDNKKSLIEDVDLFRSFLSNDMEVETLYSVSEIEASMYDSISDSIRGFSKSFYSINSKSIPLIVFWITVFLLNLFPFVFIFLSPLLLIILLEILCIYFFISKINGSTLIYSFFLHPILMVSMILIAVLSTYKTINNKVEWKGRNY